MTRSFIADRMTNVGFSETQVILNKIRQLTGQGIKITSFNSKQDTPSHVKEAARKMLLITSLF